MAIKLAYFIRQSLDKLRIAFFCQGNSDEKKISDLDVNKIIDCHLMAVENGQRLYKKTLGDPLGFFNNRQTTFLTAVPDCSQPTLDYGTPSGGSYMAFDIPTVDAEAIYGDLYELRVEKNIDRIIDLCRACKEQGIETEYLKIYETFNGRNHKLEKELFNLYGHRIQELRIHGVKYRSRKNPDGFCIVFYDTLVDLKPYFSSKKIKDRNPQFTNFLPEQNGNSSA